MQLSNRFPSSHVFIHSLALFSYILSSCTGPQTRNSPRAQANQDTFHALEHLGKVALSRVGYGKLLSMGLGANLITVSIDVESSQNEPNQSSDRFTEVGYVPPAPPPAIISPALESASFSLTSQAVEMFRSSFPTLESEAASGPLSTMQKEAVAGIIAGAEFTAESVLGVAVLAYALHRHGLVSSIVDAAEAAEAKEAAAEATPERRYGDLQTCDDPVLDALGTIKDEACGGDKKNCKDQRFE